MTFATPRRGPLLQPSSDFANRRTTTTTFVQHLPQEHLKAGLGAITPDDFSMSRNFSGAPASYDQENGVSVGDAVEVPGGMFGTVRYIGSVRGKAGVFAGVELENEFAARGKNDGDVDG